MRYNLKGIGIDNLLRLLHNKKIVLFDVERIGHDEISFTSLDKDEKKINRYILNFKTKKTPKLIKRLPKFLVTKIGIIIAIILSSTLILLLKNYTFDIEIFGENELKKDEIIEVLSQNGVEKYKVNTMSNEEIESILLNNYDRLAQVSVIRKGTTIIINLSEKLVYFEDRFEPIVAKFSGIINDIKLITGTLNCKVGDFVQKGDVLVFPYNVNTFGDKVSVKPMAEISGEIYLTEKVIKLKNETILERTGKAITEYRYKFGKFDLFKGRTKNSFALFETLSYNENISSILPINRDVIKYFELKTKVKTNNFKEIKNELEEESKKRAYEILPLGKIVDETTTAIENDDSIIAITTIKINGLLND